jgi:hypothetical protein
MVTMRPVLVSQLPRPLHVLHMASLFQDVTYVSIPSGCSKEVNGLFVHPGI